VKAHGNNYELAQLVGISPTILSRFARQERNLRLDTASKLADVLGLVLTEAK
jgi:plasmid maintenance system antidote protein VapI